MLRIIYPVCAAALLWTMPAGADEQQPAKIWFLPSPLTNNCLPSEMGPSFEYKAALLLGDQGMTIDDKGDYVEFRALSPKYGQIDEKFYRDKAVCEKAVADLLKY